MKKTPVVLNRSALFLFLLLLGFSSCKKDKFEKNSTGKSVLSEQDLLGLNIIDTTITLNTYPVLSDSVRTDEVSSTALLGSYVDPTFGKTEASLYTQFRFISARDFTSDVSDASKDLSKLVVDKVTLSMPVSEIYGETDAQTFEVYQMTENIFLDSVYYSNRNASTSTTNLVLTGEESITPSLSNNLEIPLSTSIGDDIISNNAALSTNDEFAEWFKGLYIKTNTAQISGDGAILSLLMYGSDSTTLTITYHDVDAPTTSLNYTLVVDESSARFNHFDHDYTSTVVESAINNKTLGNVEYYVQSMGGVNTEIKLPFISDYQNIEGFVVRKSELILPYVPSQSYGEVESLIALGFNEEGENIFLADQFVGNIDGTANTSESNYTFIITNYLNQLINGDVKDDRILVAPIGSSVVPNRSVFVGQNSVSPKKIELKISYTIF